MMPELKGQPAVWFIRCNGKTLHNDPATSLFVKGEPPNHPELEFDYTKECLAGGFARVGWPAAGDLRDPSWRDRAALHYADEMENHHWRYLERFRTIRVGDVVAIPAGRGKAEVYVGRVISPRRAVAPVPHGGFAYYYHFDVDRGDWFENAHRVDVEWIRDGRGIPHSFFVQPLSGVWRRGFARVREAAIDLARIAGAQLDGSITA